MYDTRRRRPDMQDPARLVQPWTRDGLDNDAQAILADQMSVVLTIDEQDAHQQDSKRRPTKLTSSIAVANTSTDRTFARDAPSAFGKAWLYTNSRLPPHLPALKLYVPTYPLLCLAARHSLAVYDPCTSPGATRPGSINLCIPSSVRHATKAMTITSTTHDTTAHIILAIRGSSTLFDWISTNVRHAPTQPPAHFLPDAGNLVHAGFLQTAHAMIDPISSHLRTLLEENSARCSHSLTLTGHSAGGAIAALLYAHILSPDSSVTSPLKSVAAVFRRVHCITFGAPPVSLLPLSKPSGVVMRREDARKLRKSVFMAFVNEGDPVARADVGVVKSLLCLYTAPVPPEGRLVEWPIPPGTLSCAGSLVLLRTPSARETTKPTRTGLAALLKSRPPAPISTSGNRKQHVTASVINDSQLRDVVFGDPSMHAMTLYKERIEAIAVGAVTASSVNGVG